MEKAICEVSFLGNLVSIYTDRIVLKKFFGVLGITSIPLNQIASVQVSPLGNVVIETAGGEKYALPVIGPQKGKKIQEAILKLQHR